MPTFIQDLRFGWRRLIKSPGFTLIAILSLALGIGANTAIFSLVNMVLFRPLPVPNPEQIVSVAMLGKNGAMAAHSYPNYLDLRDRNEAFSDLAAFRMAPMSLSHNGNNQRVWGYLVSGNYFDVLGVKAAAGRAFQPEEDKTRLSHPVAVISYAAWQNRFGGNPSAVNSEILVNGKKFTVIGVAPQGFAGTEVIYTPEIYLPFAMQRWIEPENDYLDSRASQNIFAVGRLKPGVSREQAEESLNVLMAQLARDYPNENTGLTAQIMPPGFIIPEIRRGMLGLSMALMGLVGLVLLIACTNLANLLLARAAERSKEIAIRLSLGASRSRLIRQLLTEGLLLSAAGGIVGLLLARWIIDLIIGLKPPIDIPVTLNLHLDWRVMVFALAVSLLTGLLFGLLPALQATKPDLVPALKDSLSQSAIKRSWLRNSLVVAQISVSLALLAAAGLTLRALQQLRLMNPGFNPENALMMSFDLSLQGYEEGAGNQLRTQLLKRVESLPGVESTTLSDYIPLSINFNGTNVLVEGQSQERGANAPNAMNASVGLNYFKTMGTRIIAGRDLNEQDQDGKTRSAIVNETLARRLFPGADPIQNALGQRFRTSPGREPWQIVGVAQDGKYWNIGEDPRMFVWFPIGKQLAYNTMIVRTTVNPETLIGPIRNEIAHLDPNLPVSDVTTMSKHMNLSLFPARAVASLLAAFGALALALAAIGIYGVMSYGVAQRTREIGVRMALGAARSDVLKMVMWQGMKLALIGIAIGLAISFGLAQLLSGLLYGVSRTDPLTFTAISAILAAVALIACYLPAYRATRVDPITALRYE